jgi:dienelactone hydrolase
MDGSNGSSIVEISSSNKYSRLFLSDLEALLDTSVMSSNRPIWTSLDPSIFEKDTATIFSDSSNKCQYAKDENYLHAVLSMWKKYNNNNNDPNGGPAGNKNNEVEYYDKETSPYTYYDDDDQTPLYGHIIRRRYHDHRSENTTTTTTTTPTTRVRPKKDDTTTTIVTTNIVEDIDNTNNGSVLQQQQRPGIMLFHTAAGPQDVFLFHIAAKLVSTLNCIVLICDILSDPTGWSWTDKGRYMQARDDLYKNDYRLLRSRVNAAVRALCHPKTMKYPPIIPTGKEEEGKGDYDDDEILTLGVDSQRLAALGWCLGGQPILELTRMTTTTSTSSNVTTTAAASTTGSVQSILFPDCHIRAMVSFHGVYYRDDNKYIDSIGPLQPPSIEDHPHNDDDNDDDEYNDVDKVLGPPSTSTATTVNIIPPPPQQQQQPEVLICNGNDDPFVSIHDLQITQRRMMQSGYNVTIVQYEDAKHGFTNPAQQYNANDAFDYNDIAATESWTSTIALLRRQLLYN